MPGPCRQQQRSQGARQEPGCNGIRASLSEVEAERPERPAGLIGEDAAKFEVEQQSSSKWIVFTVELSVVLGILYLVSSDLLAKLNNDELWQAWVPLLSIYD